MTTTIQQSVVEAEPALDALIVSCFDQVDYRDAYLVDTTHREYERIEQFVADFFLSQRGWVSLISLNVTSQSKIRASIDTEEYRPGTKIGSWKIYERDKNEIIFGETMGFMEYRFSLRRNPETPDLIEASTAVRYIWRRTGRYYFAAVRPVHKRIVLAMLRATVR